LPLQGDDARAKGYHTSMEIKATTSWVQMYYDPTPKLWKEIIKFKYNPDSPNIFYCRGRQSSPSWKVVPWVGKATKMGYKWKVDNGRRVRFWEDPWFDNCSLAI
jgi:hypothetical protein